MTLSAELIELYASGGPADMYYEMLTLSHPLFTRDWSIVNNPYPITATLETGNTIEVFEPYPFTASMAGTGESGNQDLEVSISNVDQTPIKEIELASEEPGLPIQLVYRVYIASNLGSPGYVVDGLTVSEINVGENQIVARASATDLVNRVFPTRLYTTTLFPGLLHV